LSLADDLLAIYIDLDLNLFLSLQEDLLKVNKENVEDQLAEVGSLYATYFALCEVAKKEHSTALMEYDNWEANSKKEYTQKIVDDGLRPTANAVDAYVVASKEYQVFQNKIINTDTKWGYLRGLVRAMEKRHDALIQICSLKKKEAGIYN
jgi:hypothetical protein